MVRKTRWRIDDTRLQSFVNLRGKLSVPRDGLYHEIKITMARLIFKITARKGNPSIRRFFDHNCLDSSRIK